MFRFEYAELIEYLLRAAYHDLSTEQFDDLTSRIKQIIDEYEELK